MNKKQMSEQDIRTKYITPAILAAGWDRDLQIREEVSFTKGKITVRRKIVKRGEQKRADYILYWKPNIPLAIVEAKDNKDKKHINSSNYNDEKIKTAVHRAEELHVDKTDMCPRYFATTVYLLLKKIFEMLPEEI